MSPRDLTSYHERSRLAALILVSQGHIVHRDNEDRTSHWELDRARISGYTTRLGRDLWWLWSAGRIEFAGNWNPVLVRLTAKGWADLEHNLAKTTSV